MTTEASSAVSTGESSQSVVDAVAAHLAEVAGTATDGEQAWPAPQNGHARNGAVPRGGRDRGTAPGGEPVDVDDVAPSTVGVPATPQDAAPADIAAEPSPDAARPDGAQDAVARPEQDVTAHYGVPVQDVVAHDDPPVAAGAAAGDAPVGAGVVDGADDPTDRPVTDGAVTDGAGSDRTASAGAGFDAAVIDGAPVDRAAVEDAAFDGAAVDGAGFASGAGVDPGAGVADGGLAGTVDAILAEGDPAQPDLSPATAVLDVLRASGWADTGEAAALRAEADRLRELLDLVVRDHRAREASAAGVENQQYHWLVPLLRAAHGVAFGSLGAKVTLRTAVLEVPPDVLATAGLRIDYGVERDGFSEEHPR